MCGRYGYPDQDQIVDEFDVAAVLARILASGDVRPTTGVGIVIEDAAAARSQHRNIVRELRAARWGLVPSWTKTLDKKLLLINARSETVLTKPSFRTAARQRRALVPASGYYEWAVNPDGTKTAFFLHDPNTPVIGFAGLYEWWKAPEGLEMPGVQDGWLCSTTIITRSAMDSLGHIHDRMPVIVAPNLRDAWLDPTVTDPDQVDALLQSIPDPCLVPTERAPG